MADKNINELSQIEALDDEALLVVEQDGEARKMPGKIFREFAESHSKEYVESAVQASQGAKESAAASEASQKASEEARDEAGRLVSQALDAVENAATVEIGTVTEGDAASVTNVGTKRAAKLNFVLPRGPQGLPGDTPVKGVDYWTDADKAEMVNDKTLIDNVAEVVKAEVPLVKSAEEPTIVGSVAEMTDTTKHYVLATDGYFYAYKEVANENYNLLKLSEVSYQSRLQDNVEGIVSSTTSNAVTGWLPLKTGDYFSFTVLFDGVRTCAYADIQRVNLKKSDGTIIVYNKSAFHFTGSRANHSWSITDTDVVGIMIHFSVSDASGSMFDISTEANLKTYQPMIVKASTADEALSANSLPYVDGDKEVETVTEWYNTGLAYNQPVDYEDRVIEVENNVEEARNDITELKEKMGSPNSASPYFRDVNFGVIPASYYQGVATTYEKIFGKTTKYATFIDGWKSLVASHSGYVTETELGAASDGQTIYLYDFKPVRITNQNKPIPKIIIIAGQHGFEKSNIYGLYYFVDNLLNRWNQHPALEYLRNHVELMIVPVLNTYGFDTLEYKNANGVNTNRNYDSYWKLVSDTTSSNYGGSEPFDQPETQIVRNLMMTNTDALLVIDFHTNGGTSVTKYEDVNWCAVCPNTDSYYNRMLDAVAHHLSAITGRFNLDYALNQPDVMMGHMTNGSGTGLLRGWATDNNFVGVLVEGFNGFPNGTEFSADVYKANEEIIANYLITALNYLAR